MRMAGFICGVLLVVSAIIWYTTPDQSERPPDSFEQAANIPSGGRDLTTGNEYAVEPVVVQPDAPIEPPIRNETPPVAVATDRLQFPEQEQKTMAAPSESPDPSWQVIWKPFRSESSALGFAERLRSVTGLRIEVQRQSPTKYVVAFPYHDEKERLRNIERIENRTGLVLVLGNR